MAIRIVPKRLLEIPFWGVVPAGAFRTYVSNGIPFDFAVIKVKVVFYWEAQNLVQVRFYHSDDILAPTTDWPGNDNLFGEVSTLGTFIGNGLIRVADCQRPGFNKNSFLKVAVFNGTGNPYNLVASITVMEM